VKLEKCHQIGEAVFSVSLAKASAGRHASFSRAFLEGNPRSGDELPPDFARPTPFLKNPKRKKPVTVCIAAICNSNSTIFGACDRMMTSGDIEFEPKLPVNKSPRPHATANPKIHVVTSSIVFLTAGDSGLQTEVMADVKIDINGRIDREPDKWINVKDAVEMYVDAYNKAKAAYVRNDVLIPRFLDADTFISRQSEMNADFILDTTKEISRSEADLMGVRGIETIITGVDTSGPHIYAVFKSANGNYVTCCDSIGFAAVGIGSRHAESQFMLAGHNPHADREETLLLTYMAKKKSEVAPGVGEGTDMFVIGPNTGSLSMMDSIQDFDMKEIHSIYKKMAREQANRFDAAKKKTKDYIAAMFAARARASEQKQQSPPAEPPPAPPDQSN
jgi:hypothetical protein